MMMMMMMMMMTFGWELFRAVLHADFVNNIGGY